MKPFRDYDLSVVIAKQLSAARKKMDLARKLCD